MLWGEDIPNIIVKDKGAKQTNIKLIAGSFKDKTALPPTPDSWAADPNNHLQIWTFKMDADAVFNSPPIEDEVTRSLFFYQGDSFSIGDTRINENHLIELDPEKEAQLINGSSEGYFLFLQGRPINEPMVQYGPFVANTDEELQDIIQEYRRTQFGGWPWATSDPVHDISLGRFSKLPDGQEVIK